MSRSNIARRTILRSAPFLVSGSWFTHIAESMARSTEETGHRPKSLLILWLQGGPSQLDTFDPHPGSWIGGDVKAIPTSMPGAEISSSLPATAEIMKYATLVRSLVSKEGDHERATYHLKTGWRPEATLAHPSIGSVICHQTLDNIEIPRHISILASQWPARGGFLGASLDAFQIGDPALPIPNLTGYRSDRRTEGALAEIGLMMENEFQKGRLRDLEHTRTLHRAATAGALSMMSSEQIKAFDIAEESESTQARFGKSAFGRGCLAAVRLLDAGVRCVEVELNGWDTHINNHDLQRGLAGVLDPALASTISLLQERELFEDTIVMCGGEFGRTPIINPASGRDHWPHGFSVLLAGGPFRRGYLHGATDANPDKNKLMNRGNAPLDPAELTDRIVTIPDLHTTLLYALGIDASQETVTPIGRPIKWSEGQVIKELLNDRAG